MRFSKQRGYRWIIQSYEFMLMSEGGQGMTEYVLVFIPVRVSHSSTHDVTVCVYHVVYIRCVSSSVTLSRFQCSIIHYRPFDKDRNNA